MRTRVGRRVVTRGEKERNHEVVQKRTGEKGEGRKAETKKR